MYQLLKLTAVDQNSNQTQTLKLVIILNHLRFETSKSKLFMLFQITKIYVWLSLSLFLAPSWTRRGSGCGMVVHRDQWSSVGDRVWCSTGSNSAWQYSLMRYRYHRFATKYIPSETLQAATNWTLRRQNKEGIEHKRVRRVESLEEKKSASPYTPDLSLPWSDSKIRVWKYAKKT